MLTRETLHRLVDDIPESAIDRAGASLVGLLDDRVLAAILSAPEDDEPLSEGERRLIAERVAARATERLTAHEDVKRLVQP